MTNSNERKLFYSPPLYLYTFAMPLPPFHNVGRSKGKWELHGTYIGII